MIGKPKGRLTLATLMGLVAVVALGLWAYRRYFDPREALIRRAREAAVKILPGTDLSGASAELGEISADGIYQRVVFTRPGVARPLVLTLPIRPNMPGIKAPTSRSTFGGPPPRTPRSAPAAPSGSPPKDTP